ncbi:MAG: hypothetical protein OXH76_03665 [Boseongicola sp.]|nr:hypothetical protein [Boseongicola sp.]
MTETDGSEARAAPVSSPAPRGTLVAAGILVLVALAVAVAGGFMLRGRLGGPAAVEQAAFDPGNVSRRAEELDAAGSRESAPAGQSGETAASGAGVGPAPSTPPGDDPMTAWLAEEAARLAERARLASDSPLARPVTEAAELVERWRPEDPEPGPAAESAPMASGGHGAFPQADAAAATTSRPAAPAVAGFDGVTHVLARGSVIPAVLESSIDSDLPGLVRARVAETVHDTVTGGHVLVPRGARLVGTYGSSARAGQRRLFVSWTDLLLPDGTPVPLGGTGSLGADGASGVRGRRSTGIWTALGAAVLFDLAGNASQILIATETGQAPERQGGLAEILGAALGNSTSQVGQEHLRELLDRGTRFRVAAGTRMNVIVEEDMHLHAQPVRGAWR